ncbi:MAG: hypothetical protein NT090_13840, partial [Acidobacteria bacterium]|nr:hypothetical protein [Acidobacteriota bacterium]
MVRQWRSICNHPFVISLGTLPAATLFPAVDKALLAAGGASRKQDNLPGPATGDTFAFFLSEALPAEPQQLAGGTSDPKLPADAPKGEPPKAEAEKDKPAFDTAGFVALCFALAPTIPPPAPPAVFSLSLNVIPNGVPDAAPGVAPDAASGVVRDAAPGIVPGFVPGVASDAAPGVAPDAAPDVAPGAAPGVVLDVAPG